MDANSIADGRTDAQTNAHADETSQGVSGSSRNEEDLPFAPFAPASRL